MADQTQSVMRLGDKMRDLGAKAHNALSLGMEVVRATIAVQEAKAPIYYANQPVLSAPASPEAQAKAEFKGQEQEVVETAGKGEKTSKNKAMDREKKLGEMRENGRNATAKEPIKKQFGENKTMTAGKDPARKAQGGQTKGSEAKEPMRKFKENARDTSGQSREGGGKAKGQGQLGGGASPAPKPSPPAPQPQSPARKGPGHSR